MTAAVREAINALVGEVCAEAGVDRTDILELRVRRQPDHAPPAPRHRSDRARRRAVRARHRQRARPAGASEIDLDASTPAPGSTCCPASPAMSAPTPPAWCCRRRPHLNDEMTLLVDVGTNAEIVLGNRQRLLACSSPTGPAFEGAQISLRPARGARRDRARAHRPRHAGAALQGDRLRAVVGRAGLRRGRPRRPASPASAARASSR